MPESIRPQPRQEVDYSALKQTGTWADNTPMPVSGPILTPERKARLRAEMEKARSLKAAGKVSAEPVRSVDTNVSGLQNSVSEPQPDLPVTGEPQQETNNQDNAVSSHMEDDPSKLTPLQIKAEVSRMDREQNYRRSVLEDEKALQQKAIDGGLSIDAMRSLLLNNFNQNRARLSNFKRYTNTDEFAIKKQSSEKESAKIVFKNISQDDVAEIQVKEAAPTLPKPTIKENLSVEPVVKESLTTEPVVRESRTTENDTPIKQGEVGVNEEIDIESQGILNSNELKALATPDCDCHCFSSSGVSSINP